MSSIYVPLKLWHGRIIAYHDFMCVVHLFNSVLASLSTKSNNCRLFGLMMVFVGPFLITLTRNVLFQMKLDKITSQFRLYYGISLLDLLADDTRVSGQRAYQTVVPHRRYRFTHGRRVLGTSSWSKIVLYWTILSRTDTSINGGNVESIERCHKKHSL